MNREGWKVKPNFALPKGYELREDAEFLHLYRKRELVAKFTHHATPESIKAITLKHKNRENISRQAGFTIVELLVAVSLIMLIIGVSLPYYMDMQNSAKMSVYEAQVGALEQAAQYHLLSGGGDVIWYAECGEPARSNPAADHESWMYYFDKWPENPLDTGSFMVEIQDGEIRVSP